MSIPRSWDRVASKYPQSLVGNTVPNPIEITCRPGEMERASGQGARWMGFGPMGGK